MGGKEERKTDISILIEMGKKERNERKEREEEWMLRNGGLLLEKRISYFNGKYYNPIHTFSAKELREATDNYNPNLISESGPCKRWYKGCLEGRVIFVKKYYDYYPFVDPERVSNGIAVAAQASGHKNALKLLGCCLETPNPTLVFEFPKNGNLDDQLRSSNPTCLPWRIRLKIANEIASVITYLHTKFPRPIIHRDINPKNIQLDQDVSAKLSDFMFCMTLPEGKTQVKSKRIMGSHRYIAPELRRNGVYSEKSDVFGFGSLLLFLLMGKSFISQGYKLGDIPSYVRNHTMNEIVDSRILVEAEAASELILRCLRDNAKERPFMLDVAKQLKRIQRYYTP